MKRFVMFFLSLLSLISLYVAPYSYAQQQFSSNVDVRYDVGVDGTTTITHNITLENLYSNLYAVTYTLSLEGIKPINVKAYENSQPIQADVKQDGTKSSIKVTFPDAVVGKGSKRQFSVVFDDKTLAVKTGEVWEISIPKLSDPTSFDNFSTTLSVPQSLGQVAYISPQPLKTDQKSGDNIFTFNKDLVSRGGVTAAFGQFQVFSFNLIYHLENPLGRSASIDVAIPPDTAYQRMNYSDITPIPSNVHVDPDGNWLASFLLKPRERIDVTAKGAVQIFAQPRSFPIPTQEVLSDNKKETDVWQTKDPTIFTLANQLKTPRAIYDYVVNNLSYDYSRVKPNVERLGAKEALAHPKNAICTEFTDAFIALARAAGIPAREINGYAYTENPQIQPLSLVADVLHAWPEYWDASRNTWVAVDPTWGSTTGVIDYFSKLDLRHFTFVIHGEESRKPYPPGSYKLGPNPQKDVYVSFGQLPPSKPSNPTITIGTLRNLPFANMLLNAKIRNTSQNAVYNQLSTVLFDDKTPIVTKIDILPPYGSFDIPIEVPYGFLGQKIPNKVTILVGSARADYPTYKTYVVISNLIFILLVIFVIIFIVYWKVLKAYFKNRYGKSDDNGSTTQKPT